MLAAPCDRRRWPRLRQARVITRPLATRPGCSNILAAVSLVPPFDDLPDFAGTLRPTTRFKEGPDQDSVELVQAGIHLSHGPPELLDRGCQWDECLPHRVCGFVGAPLV